MNVNPLVELAGKGQSVWLDNLARPLIRDGVLERLVKEDGLSGITSNPAIFQIAMTSGDAYDEQIRTLSDQGKSAGEIYEALAIRDIQNAADIQDLNTNERGGGGDPLGKFMGVLLDYVPCIKMHWNHSHGV